MFSGPWDFSLAVQEVFPAQFLLLSSVCCRLLSAVVVCCRLLSCVVVCCRLLFDFIFRLLLDLNLGYIIMMASSSTFKREKKVEIG